MKRIRILTVLMFALALPVTFARPVGAIEVTETEVAAPETADTAVPTKGGVLAAIGCGLAITSLVVAPNPISAFVVGFDCMFMLIDAGYTPDH